MNYMQRLIRAHFLNKKPLCVLQDPALPRIPVIGNGDILSYEDWQAHRGTILHSIIYLNAAYTQVF